MSHLGVCKLRLSVKMKIGSSMYVVMLDFMTVYIAINFALSIFLESWEVF
jgi:hypothetical protein